jgi:hypothetical protein
VLLVLALLVEHFGRRLGRRIATRRKGLANSGHAVPSLVDAA